MKIYVIDGKPYTMGVAPDMDFVCGQCDIADLNREDGACKNECLLEKCTNCGYDKYFKEYKGEILENMEVIDFMKEKKVYKRMAKGFTRRDVLRELILEMKTKYGVDIVRKCDSVDQCKAVIEEIIRIACNNELSSAKDLVAKKEKELDDVKNEIDKILATNKRMCGILNSRDRELFKLRNENDTLKKELDTTEKSRIEWVGTAKYNDKLYADEFIRARSLEDELKKFKSDNEILGMWLKEAEDRGVISLIVFKAKRLFNKIFGNGYDK